MELWPCFSKLCMIIEVLQIVKTNNTFMENSNLQFMVDFTMPKEMPDEFVALIPRQRAAVNKLMNDGKLLNYSLALEHGKLWAVFAVESEAELIDIVYGLPLTEFMKVRISELTFYNAANTFTATFSVN